MFLATVALLVAGGFFLQVNAAALSPSPMLAGDDGGVFSGLSGCPRIVSRVSWGARPPKAVTDLKVPVEYAIIAHTVTPECNSIEKCSELVRNIQTFHMYSRHYSDIGYNFLVSSNGDVYEGVGYSRVGAHTKGFNDRSLGIALIGDFLEKDPTELQVAATLQLLNCAQQLEYLQDDYKLVGARQAVATLSPGNRLYKLMQSWPHWSRRV